MAGPGVFPKENGDIIYYQDYNAIRAIIEPILGVGSGNNGYGQVLTSSNINQFDQITELHWDNLRSDIDKCLTHQSGGTSLTNVSTSTTILKDLINQYKTGADTAVTNKDLVFAQTQSALGTGISSTYATPWKTSIRHRVTVTFSTANDARHFFNLGGNIRLTASQTGSVAATKDQRWAELIDSLGGIYYTPSNYRTGGNIIIKAQTFSVSPYAANFYQAWGERTSDTTLVITALFNDASVQTGFNQSQAQFDENVTLSITSAVDFFKSIGAIVGVVPSSVTNLFALGP